MESKNKTDDKTFVANIRCNIKHIAAIASYLNSRGVFVETKSRVASEAIKILAYGVPQKVDTLLDAVRILKDLGYDESLDKSSKYYGALTKGITIEMETETITEITQRLVDEDRKKGQPATVSMGDRKLMESSLDMVDNDEKSDPSEPLDMPSNEEARSAFGDMSGAPVEDEGER